MSRTLTSLLFETSSRGLMKVIRKSRSHASGSGRYNRVSGPTVTRANCYAAAYSARTVQQDETVSDSCAGASRLAAVIVAVTLGGFIAFCGRIP
jgi:hypothetical protein